jgi:large subunit ribosomal protein L9
MEVILLKDVENLGEKHAVITVKPGFGRNYLIPKGSAIIANKLNLSKLETLKAKAAEVEAVTVEKFELLKEKLQENILKIGAKSGTTGKIFGSVTNLQLAQAILEQWGEEVDRKSIEIEEEIKELGEYVAIAKVYKDIEARVRFEVVKE